mmetsp:Transcript_29356/g.44268  ORF Transcript_29356/g.44268 Transcript_29356/m.44268 type:complete len:150 (-) Transcript_29356:5587-6036(-)
MIKEDPTYIHSNLPNSHQMPGRMSLLLKNNVTLLESVELKGRGGTGYLEVFDIMKASFDAPELSESVAKTIEGGIGMSAFMRNLSDEYAATLKESYGLSYFSDLCKNQSWMKESSLKDCESDEEVGEDEFSFKQTLRDYVFGTSLHAVN